MTSVTRVTPTRDQCDTCDLKTCHVWARPEYAALLQHPGLLKIAQDPLGVAGRRVAREGKRD